MIVGIGVDIVDIRRIEASVNRFGDRFVKKILAEDEMRDITGKRLVAYVARQFAAKEAVSKALGTGMRVGVSFRRIVILRNGNGAPVVHLREGAATRASSVGAVTIQVSLSDEKNYAIAYAVATSD